MDATFKTTLDFRQPAPVYGHDDNWIPRRIVVSFHQTWTRSADQLEEEDPVLCKSVITFCLLRWRLVGHHRWNVTSAMTIQNPKDKVSTVVGYRRAFNRAVEMLCPKTGADYERLRDDLANQAYKTDICAEENRTTLHQWFEKECVPQIIEEAFEEEPEVPVADGME